MTPKETAQDLFEKYSIIPLNIGFTYNDVIQLRKKCANILVDELIKELDTETHYIIEYWKQVKKEIELI